MKPIESRWNKNSLIIIQNPLNGVIQIPEHSISKKNIPHPCSHWQQRDGDELNLEASGFNRCGKYEGWDCQGPLRRRCCERRSTREDPTRGSNKRSNIAEFGVCKNVTQSKRKDTINTNTPTEVALSGFPVVQPGRTWTQLDTLVLDMVLQCVVQQLRGEIPEGTCELKVGDECQKTEESHQNLL